MKLNVEKSHANGLGRSTNEDFFCNDFSSWSEQGQTGIFINLPMVSWSYLSLLQFISISELLEKYKIHASTQKSAAHLGSQSLSTIQSGRVQHRLSLLKRKNMLAISLQLCYVLLLVSNIAHVFSKMHLVVTLLHICVYYLLKWATKWGTNGFVSLWLIL